MESGSSMSSSPVDGRPLSLETASAESLSHAPVKPGDSPGTLVMSTTASRVQFDSCLAATEVRTPE